MNKDFAKLKKEAMNYFTNIDCLEGEYGRIYSIKIRNDTIRVIYMIKEDDFRWMGYPDGQLEIDAMSKIFSSKQNSVLFVQVTYKNVKWNIKYIDSVLIPLKNKRYITRNDDDSLFIGFLYGGENIFQSYVYDIYFEENGIMKRDENLVQFDIHDYQFIQYDGTKFDKLYRDDVSNDGSLDACIFLEFKYTTCYWDYIDVFSYTEIDEIEKCLFDASLPMHPFIKKFIES